MSDFLEEEWKKQRIRFEVNKSFTLTGDLQGTIKKIGEPRG